MKFGSDWEESVSFGSCVRGHGLCQVCSEHIDECLSEDNQIGRSILEIWSKLTSKR
jgi:hypothetical protein